MTTLLAACSYLSSIGPGSCPLIRHRRPFGTKQTESHHSYKREYRSLTAFFHKIDYPCRLLQPAVAQCRQLQLPFSDRQPIDILSNQKHDETHLYSDCQNSLCSYVQQFNEGWRQTWRGLITRSSLGARLFGAYRFVITATHTFITTLDYQINFTFEEALSERAKGVHRRAAKRMLRVCKSHGGIYNKLGQYVSTLNHIIPEEYTSTLLELTDRAASLPWTEISTVLKDDFSPSHESQHFSHIDNTPIGSASLAQVHRAIRRSDGREVAIKIQYPHLRAQTQGDLRALKLLVNFIGWVFPEYGFGWLFPEFEQSALLELDFRQEAFNAERIASLLSHRKEVYVPKVDWSLTSSRCLVMEFVRGIKVTDFTKLDEAGIGRIKLAELICDVFGEMVHVHGFLQCDPHPGNLLVNKGQKGLQLILLDHGMYRRLDPTVRYFYCQLWRSLLTQDVTLGKHACKHLGIDESALDLLSLIFTYRTMKSQYTGLGAKMDYRDRENAKNQYKGFGIGDINEFLYSLPRDILWIFRSTNIVRSLNHYLGNTTHSRLLITGYNVVQGIHLGSSVGGVTIDEMTQLEDCILDAWIDAQHLPRLDPTLLEGDQFFREWSTAEDRGAKKMTLGPVSRKKVQARISYRLNSLHHNAAPIDDVLPHDLPAPCNDSTQTPVLESIKPSWVQLPGVGTLNVPVCSEVVEWKRSSLPRATSLQCVAILWKQLWAAIDVWYFTFQLWGFTWILRFMEDQVENIFTRVMPYAPLQE